MKRILSLLILLGFYSLTTNAQNRELVTEEDGFQWYRISSETSRGAESIDGATIIPLSQQFQYVSYKTRPGYKGYFTAGKNNEWGAYDIYGKEIIAPQYRYLAYDRFKGFLGKKRGEKEYTTLGITLDANGHASSYSNRTTSDNSDNKELKTSTTYKDEDGYEMKYYIYRYTHNDKTFYAAFTEDEKRITPDVEARPLYRGGGIFTVETDRQTTEGYTIVEGYNLKGKLVFPAKIQAYSIHYKGDGLFILDHSKGNRSIHSLYNIKSNCIIPESLEYDWIGYYKEEKQIWCLNEKRGYYRTYSSDGKYFAEGQYYMDGTYSATSFYNLSDLNERALFDYYKYNASKATIEPVEDGKRGVNIEKKRQAQANKQTQQPTSTTYIPTYTPTQTPTNTQPAQQHKTDNTQYREKCKYCMGSGKCQGLNSPGGTRTIKLHCNGSGRCSTCGGTGLMSTGFGDKTKCSECNGNWKCKYCKGTGKCDKCGGTGYKR